MKRSEKMKINNVNLSPVNPYKANELNAQKSVKSLGAQTDKLEISSQAKQLSEISSYSAERNERIQEIKAQIDAGTYKVDSREIAKNLLSYYKK